ncbi:hypothetical protein [Alistipes sp.]|uniref:hypothetical protein n=1 Tax=Alistipes sp. TaxID=1872444 RepID=UPI003A83560D
MNRRLSLLSAVFALLILSPIRTVSGREADSSPEAAVVSREPGACDTLRQGDLVENDLMTLRRTSDDVVLEVAGFGITLSSREWLQPADPEQPRSRVSPTLLSGSEYGFIIPTGLDYGAYPTGSDRFFDLRSGKSFHLASTLIGLKVEMGRRRLFQFATGLRYTIDNYRLSDPSLTLGNDAGMVIPVTLDERADKSKLRVTSLGLPLGFSCQAARNLSVSVTGYFDFTMGANAIYKRPKVKNPLAGVNTFRFGVGVAVAYHSIGVYVRYSVTPLFEDRKGPGVRPLSIGLCLDI